MLLERLKKLREGLGLSQKDIATILHVAQSTYTLYENGKREPSFAILCELSKFYKVSTDYLLGIDDIKNKESFKSFSSKYQEFCRLLVSFDKADEFIENLNLILEYLKNTEGEDLPPTQQFFEYIVGSLGRCIRYLFLLEPLIEKNGLPEIYTEFIEYAEFLRRVSISSINGMWYSFLRESYLTGIDHADEANLKLVESMASVAVNNLDLIHDMKSIKKPSFIKSTNLEKRGVNAEKENDAQRPGSGDDTTTE